MGSDIRINRRLQGTFSRWFHFSVHWNDEEGCKSDLDFFDLVLTVVPLLLLCTAIFVFSYDW